MARNLSLAAMTMIYARETGDGIIALAEVSTVPPDEVITFRLAAWHENVTHNGEEYIRYPFDVILPQEERENQPQGQIIFDNVVPTELIPWMRSLREPPKCTLRLVRALDPDDVVATYYKFTLASRTYDQLTITCDLARPNMTRRPYPKHTFSPATAPGLRWST